AVPMAAKAMARTARSRSAEGATMAALLPPSSRIARAKRAARRGPTSRPIAVEPVADTTATRASATRAWPISRPPITIPDKPFGRVPHSPHRAPDDRLCGQRRERSLLGWLPHYRVAADESESRIPGPHRHGEVESRDDATDAERMPSLHHPVVAALGRDGAAIELPR